MSTYSSLILAANTDFRIPSPEEIQEVFSGLGLLHPERVDWPFGNLANDISELFFNDETANSENSHFFCPDSISIHHNVEIMAPEDDFTGTGLSFHIHGNGYFFPWEMVTLRDRVIRTPKLLRLRDAVQQLCGGHFVLPTEHETFLNEVRIDGENGWMWFGSQSL